MKKKILYLAIALLSVSSTFANCRHWHVRFFGYEILTHNNSDCNDSDGNWEWFWE